MLICNKCTYSVTLDKDALLTELGYFFTCSVFQSLANNEINSEPQSNVDLITHVIYTKNDAVYEGQCTLRRFYAVAKETCVYHVQHKQQFQFREIEEGYGVLT